MSQHQNKKIRKTMIIRRLARVFHQLLIIKSSIMKKLLFALFLVAAVTSADKAAAQVNINVNLGRQPAWGPTGYDYVNYYYLPDLDVYYSVPRRQFVYPNGNQWVYANTLPSRYGNYDLYRGYKVVINDENPFRHAADYRSKYGRYKNWNGARQPVIRDHHDERYKNNGPGRSDHEDRGNGKNRGRGNGKGHGRKD